MLRPERIPSCGRSSLYPVSCCDDGRQFGCLKLFTDGVHHFDENGLKNPEDEPPHIQKIHREIVEFVTEWLKDWKSPKA